MAVPSFAYDRILTSKWSMNPLPSVRRTPMSDGLPKQMPKFTRTMKRHQVSYLLTDAQVDAFYVWWETTASFGTKFFDFVNPRTDATEDGRIVTGSFNITPYDVCVSRF